MEIWKVIPGYEGLYQVSNLGRVKSLNFNNTGREGICAMLNSEEVNNTKVGQLKIVNISKS
jgi:hypothetical protein